MPVKQAMKQIEGQISIFEYMKQIKPLSVDIMGLCDDAYCPKCGSCLDEYQSCDKECPVCHTQLDWKPWHVLNDEWFLKNKEMIMICN